MKAILLKGETAYIFNKQTIVEDDFYLTDEMEVRREIYSIRREGFKLIKTNDPLFSTVDGLEGAIYEIIKYYPQGLTQDFKFISEFKEQNAEAQTVIKAGMKLESQTAQEVDKVIKMLIENGQKQKALDYVENVYGTEEERNFLGYHFRKRIRKKFGSNE